MTKYEYVIDKYPRIMKYREYDIVNGYRVQVGPLISPSIDEKATKDMQVYILNKRGQEGWIYSGTDPMGNMVFRREIMEN